MKDRKIAIFGAGFIGKRAYCEYKSAGIVCFIDNNISIIGKELYGIPIISLEEFLRKKTNAKIIIASIYFSEIISQLEEYGYDNYSVFFAKTAPFYPTNDVIYNQYETASGCESEEEYRKVHQNDPARRYINHWVDQFSGSQLLFDQVEIETYNRCNGSCSFCPVSKQNDTRPLQVMQEELFQKIIDELSSLNYQGRLALFSNNEPFLDERIIDFQKYARKKLPHARLHLYTNGTLVTLDRFNEIIPYLDELIIDNYQQELKLHKNSRDILAVCEKNDDLRRKVTIALRKPYEILTTRGGDAPNRKEKEICNGVSCMLPYRQLVIRPNGEVSLCCNDALGKTTLGDLKNNSIIEVWNSEKAKNIRAAIKTGRENVEQCKFCDVMNLG